MTEKKPTFEEWAGLSTKPELVVDNQPTSEEPDDDPHALDQAYGIYRRQGGGDAVEIFLASGDVHVIFYSRIVEMIARGDTLMIQPGTGYLITLMGQHLGELRRRMAARKVCFIKEGATGPENVCIQAIQIEYPGG